MNKKYKIFYKNFLNDQLINKIEYYLYYFLYILFGNLNLYFYLVEKFSIYYIIFYIFRI